MSRRVAWIATAVAVVVVVSAVVALQWPSDEASPASPVPTQASRTAPVPPPTTGSTGETVPPGAAAETTPAGSADSVALSSAVTVSVEAVERRRVKAISPGEVTGPGIVLRLSITNDSDAAIDVSSASVTLLYGKANSVATPTTAEPSRPFGGQIGPGETTRSAYVFEVPQRSVSPLAILVQYQAGAVVARFDR